MSRFDGKEYLMTVARTCPFILPFILSACGQPNGEESNGRTRVSDASVQANAAPTAHDSPANGHDGAENGVGSDGLTKWTGRWNGPEGLFLDIRPASDGRSGMFDLTVKDNLDSQSNYMGTARGNAIIFMRDGESETIRAGTGAETGFRDLMSRKTCLIVQTGKEGYCR
jgi:hypothetical protein